MTTPFSSALSTAFTFSFIACLVAAGVSGLRGGTYHLEEAPEEPTREAGEVAPAAPQLRSRQ